MSLTLREATGAELGGWDALVEAFPNHRVVHTRAWIESLAASGCGRPLFLVFEAGTRVVACFPGLLTTKGGYRIFGSPMAGWQTVSLGPAYAPDLVSTTDLFTALVPWLERHYGVDYIELLHNDLDAAAMRAAGFVGRAVGTMRATLYPHDETRTFQQLKDSARRNIRRAERLGLVVRVERDDAFVDEHYDQLREVYLRRGHALPFSQRRVMECFRHLRDAGHLLALSVSLPGGRVSIATGMFLLKPPELSLWMWAHRSHYRWYRPTELMTWTAMRQAIAQGCEAFDLMGAGEFKSKFGGFPDQTKTRWMRARRPWLLAGRRLAETGFRWGQMFVGRLAAMSRVPRFARRSDRQAPACVLGDIDLVRALGRDGIASVVAAPPGSPARYSRHTKAVLDTPDPWDEPESTVARLLRFAEAQPEPPVLFYQDDASLLMASRYRDQLQPLFRYVIPAPELVEQLVDKSRFVQLARQLGLPVPSAHACRPAEQPPPNDLAFPLVLKPLIRRPRQWDPISGGAKAVRVDSDAALRALWPRLAAARVPVLLQQLIPGDESRIESYHVYVDAGGRVVGEFTGRKIRTAPPVYGDSTAVEITAAADVRDLGRTLCQKLKLTGVAKFDFKRDPDGRLLLFEVNPRFTLWHHAGAAAGVNIPALVYRDLTGATRATVPQARAGTLWCKPWRDAGAARASGVPLRRWALWALRSHTVSGLAWDDPWPLLRSALRRWFRRVPPSAPSPKLRRRLTPQTQSVPEAARSHI